MTQERQEQLEKLQAILDVRLRFNDKWNKVTVQIGSDEGDVENKLQIVWEDPRIEGYHPYHVISKPLDALNTELEEQIEKLKDDIPDPETANILYEAVKDQIDESIEIL